MAVVAYSPVESEHPGFFIIPGYTKYGASADGRIINLRTGHEKAFYQLRGYPATTVMCDEKNVMVHMFQHRLIALAFHGPMPEDKPLVNHKDGVKTNHHPSNLEWISHSGNSHHAYRIGLRSDNRPVLMKDLLTEKITRFYSLTECARYFGVNGSTFMATSIEQMSQLTGVKSGTIAYALKTGRQYNCFGYLFKYLSDKDRELLRRRYRALHAPNPYK